MAASEDGKMSGTDTGILENALVMIVVLDRKGTILAWNHAAESITGWSAGDVIGRTEIWKALYPDRQYRQEITGRIATILAAKQCFENLETTIRTRSGGSRIILWNTREIAGEGGARAVAVGIDVTEQRQADLFRESIIDNAHILIAVLDRGRVLVWNKAAEGITGYPAASVIGSNAIWQHLYPDPAYRQEITRRITEIIRRDRYFENFETRIVTRSGNKKIISWNTRRIGAGGDQQDIAIGLDITARRQAEEALLSYMTEMAMRLKGPVEIIRDNLTDVANLVRQGRLEPEEIALILDGQVRNAGQVAKNVQEFQRAVAQKHREIPEAYRKFLEGE